MDQKRKKGFWGRKDEGLTELLQPTSLDEIASCQFMQSHARVTQETTTDWYAKALSLGVENAGISSAPCF